MFYFNGDSFVYGLELENIDDRFSTLISKHYNKKEFNDSIRGASNQRILRTTMEALATHPEIESVFLMWTDPTRFEHYLEPNKYASDSDGWRRLTTFRLQDNKFLPSERDEFIRKFHHPNMRIINKSLLMYTSYVRTPEHVLNELLNYILQIQLICNAKNIKCTMAYSFTHGILDNVDIKKYFTNTSLYKKIDWSQKFWLDQDVFWSMNTFCKEQNVDFGPGLHPLKNGHFLTANKIIDKLLTDK